MSTKGVLANVYSRRQQLSHDMGMTRIALIRRPAARSTLGGCLAGSGRGAVRGRGDGTVEADARTSSLRGKSWCGRPALPWMNESRRPPEGERRPHGLPGPAAGLRRELPRYVDCELSVDQLFPLRESEVQPVIGDVLRAEAQPPYQPVELLCSPTVR